MKLRTCKHCEIEFDVYSQRKQQLGGYMNVCADCTEELQQEKEVRDPCLYNRRGEDGLHPVP